MKSIDENLDIGQKNLVKLTTQELSSFGFSNETNLPNSELQNSLFSSIIDAHQASYDNTEILQNREAFPSFGFENR